MQAFTSHLDGFHDVSSQMIDDLRRRANEHFRRHETEKAGLTTITAFEAHRAKVRDNLVDAMAACRSSALP